MKTCTKCRKNKPLDMFYNSKSCKDGKHPQCKECKKQSDRSRYEKKKEYICEKQRDRYAKKAEYEREKAKERYKKSVSTEEGRKRVRKIKNDWAYNRARSDPSYRISKSIGSSIRNQVKKNGIHKFKYLGYTCDELMSHLEKQFTSKMSWDNYGSYWHIDHITPKSSFNIKEAGDSEFMACWCLSNLRPLEAIENLKKSSKIEVLV